MVIVDSHCHLVSNGHERQSKDLETILKNAKRMDVKYMLAISTCMSDLEQNIKIASLYENIFCSVGIHPSYSNESLDMELMSRYLDNERVVGIGEVGLDYFYSDPEKGEPSKSEQQKLFHKMLSLSKQSTLPYIFHARDCYEDIFGILSEYANLTGVFHCYTGDVDNARIIIDKGFYISLSGILTFKNSGDQREVLQYIPLDKLLIETDSPYLSPVPFRGQINEPAYVRLVAERIAEEREMRLEEIAEITTRNFFTLFDTACSKNSKKQGEEFYEK